jgi:hypothetical protein
MKSQFWSSKFRATLFHLISSAWGSRVPPPPQQQEQNQNWALNALGEEVGQNQMDLDSNIEAIVEGDEAEFNEFLDLMEDVQEQVQQHEAREGQQAEEINLDASASLGYVSTPDSGVTSPKLPDDVQALEEVPIVLALQAPPVNFSVEEVQQHELISANNSDESMVHDNGRSSSGGSGETGNLQVGMALLPDNVDMYHVFLGLSK